MPFIEQRVRAFVTDCLLFGRAAELRSEDSFLDKGIIDSTGVLELVQFIEQEFQLTVENEELVAENLDSLNLLTSFIERKLSAAENTFQANASTTVS
jgi:acyl carrier protein